MEQYATGYLDDINSSYFQELAQYVFEYAHRLIL